VASFEQFFILIGEGLAGQIEFVLLGHVAALPGPVATKMCKTAI
jgi:hypothetical protein